MEVPPVPVAVMSEMVGGSTVSTVSDTAELEVKVVEPSPYETMMLPVIVCADGRPILTVIVPPDSVPEMVTPAVSSAESRVTLVKV